MNSTQINQAISRAAAECESRYAALWAKLRAKTVKPAAKSDERVPWYKQVRKQPTEPEFDPKKVAAARTAILKSDERLSPAKRFARLDVMADQEQERGNVQLAEELRREARAFIRKGDPNRFLRR